MTVQLHTIKANKKARRPRKRIGRGNAAGQGTYSGRGLKGQKARSGVSNLKRLGMKQVLLRTPKKRGFKSNKPKAEVVNLSTLNDNFKSKETVSPDSLTSKGLIKGKNRPVKILGKGELKLSELNFRDVQISKNAEEKINKKKGVIK